ncbi:MAG: gliding motility lipoprotein GldD [Bacteroidales bacterium]|nr:gliding motility lipoprotein GldD [Bacteroidales bacterium]
MKHRFTIILTLLIAMFFAISCNEDVTPKPRAYFRIDIPQHDFIPYKSQAPFSFQYADYAIVSNANKPGHPYWLFLDYPKFNARIYLSYSDIEGNVARMLNDAHDLAFKHISVANDIQQKLIILPESKVYGLLYSIKGEKVASPINFYVTDSVSHFMRGALYFNNAPKNDSLSPIIKGIEKDIWHLVESLRWKEEL